MTEQEVLQVVGERLGGERLARTFSSFEEASEWLNGREGRQVVIVTGKSGAGKDELVSKVDPAKVLLLDSIGHRPADKWLIDLTKIKWPSPWNVAAGTADNFGEFVKNANVFRGVELLLFVIPTPQVARDIQKLKIRDSDPSLPPTWKQGREREIRLTDAKLLSQHVKYIKTVAKFAPDVPVGVVVNTGPIPADAKGWKRQDDEWLHKTESNHLPMSVK